MAVGIAATARPAQAGSGTTADIPASNLVPLMDGVCDPVEYADAFPVNFTVGTAPAPTVPVTVWMKRTATDAYFCFGGPQGLPLPNGGASHVVIYVDPNHDGDLYGSNADDFRVSMPYDGFPWAVSWGTGFFNGDPIEGWQAVRYKSTEDNSWTVEIKIDRQRMGGWKHTVGLALFYHWWRWQGDDYSWPANGIWLNARNYGNGQFNTDLLEIGPGSTPGLDGQCGTEYSDAASVNFGTTNGDITAYFKHSINNLNICLHNLAVPAPGLEDQPNAVLYLDRTNHGGGAPGANDFRFAISYNGAVQAFSGDGAGFSIPVPGGYAVARSPYTGGWDAEFQVSSTLLGNWWDRNIGLAVAQQNVAAMNDEFAWPLGYSSVIPNSWAEAKLVNLSKPPSIYLPVIQR